MWKQSTSILQICLNKFKFEARIFTTLRIEMFLLLVQSTSSARHIRKLPIILCKSNEHKNIEIIYYSRVAS